MPTIKKFYVQFNSNRNKKIKFENVDDSITVSKLKEMIIEKEGTGFGQISTFVFNSQTMEDDVKCIVILHHCKLRLEFSTNLIFEFQEF